MVKTIIVLRIGEIFLKGKNRRNFFAAFIRNAKFLIRDLPEVTVEAKHLYALVHFPPELEKKCISRFQRLFGLTSLSIGYMTQKSISDITTMAVKQLSSCDKKKTFKVETRRRDKTFSMQSPQISQQIGANIHHALKLKVDVNNPDVIVHVVIDINWAYIYIDVIHGPGGLPIGVSDKISLMLSGGIDSPVAGWSIMRRGCPIHAIYFHSSPYTSENAKQKVVDLVSRLSQWQGSIALDVVHFTDVQKTLRNIGTGDMAILLYRRMMIRTACLLANNNQSKAIVTGENLGQVASQTLSNIHVIEHASSLPILRPLIGYDKHEIITKAKHIETYEISIQPYDDCCALFIPKNPVTRGKIIPIEKAEAPLDVHTLAQSLADNAERIDINPDTN